MTWNFKKNDNIEIDLLKTAFETHGALEDSWHGTFFSLFLSLIPKHKVTFYAVIINYTNKDGTVTRLKEDVTLKELDMIAQVMKERITAIKQN